jgi:hypothetical protein
MLGRMTPTTTGAFQIALGSAESREHIAAVLPIPGSPRTTRTPLSPALASASSPAMRSRSTRGSSYPVEENSGATCSSRLASDSRAAVSSGS